MTLSQAQVEFLEHNHAAAMITVADDRRAKAVRVGVALVDGRLWSSGTQDRRRTARLRRDPRCTVFVFEQPGPRFLTLETTASIIEGPEAVDCSVRLFRVMQGRPEGPLGWFGGELDKDAFRQRMVEESRLVYDLRIDHAYGLG